MKITSKRHRHNRALKATQHLFTRFPIEVSAPVSGLTIIDNVKRELLRPDIVYIEVTHPWDNRSNESFAREIEKEYFKNVQNHFIPAPTSDTHTLALHRGYVVFVEKETLKKLEGTNPQWLQNRQWEGK